jgi:hypothetical protein
MPLRGDEFLFGSVLAFHQHLGLIRLLLMLIQEESHPAVLIHTLSSISITLLHNDITYSARFSHAIAAKTTSTPPAS